MAFLDLYTLKTIQKLVKKNSGNIEDLQNQIRSLSQITLKNNLRDQEATGLRVTSAPSNDQDVIRYADIKYSSIVDNANALSANNNHEFTPQNLTITNGFYQMFLSTLVGNIDCTFNFTLRKLNRDSFTDIIRIPKTIDGSDVIEFRIALKANGKIQIRCNNSFAYLIIRAKKIG